MKKINLLLALVLCTFLTSCDEDLDDNGNNNGQNPPTAQEFASLRTNAYNNIKQQFTFNAAEGATLTSAKGVELIFSSNSLTLNGNPVTGTVDVEYAEIYDRGGMLVTNKTTMGVMPDGKLNMLVSGGEFYINATQNGQQLELTGGMQLVVPALLTGGGDEEMTLWDGVIDENGNLIWEENDDQDQQEWIGLDGGIYYCFLKDFGWTNIDRFVNDPRPKTTIYVDVPEGYDNTNSAVYLSFNEEGNALATLDTYDEETGLFSEHYGQIPIGLECHVIFVSEGDGEWIYAIKAVTIEANGIITFTNDDLSSVSEADLIAAINALP